MLRHLKIIPRVLNVSGSSPSSWPRRGSDHDPVTPRFRDVNRFPASQEPFGWNACFICHAVERRETFLAHSLSATTRDYFCARMLRASFRERRRQLNLSYIVQIYVGKFTCSRIDFPFLRSAERNVQRIAMDYY